MNLDDRLRQLFVDVFDVDLSAVDNETSSTSLDSWDSVAHLNLVLALEGEFDVQFEAEEIPDLVSFRAIRKRLESVDRASA